MGEGAGNEIAKRASVQTHNMGIGLREIHGLPPYCSFQEQIILQPMWSSRALHGFDDIENIALEAKVVERWTHILHQAS